MKRIFLILGLVGAFALSTAAPASAALVAAGRQRLVAAKRRLEFRHRGQLPIRSLPVRPRFILSSRPFSARALSRSPLYLR